MEFKHPEIPSTEAAKIASANHKTNGKLGKDLDEELIKKPGKEI